MLTIFTFKSNSANFPQHGNAKNAKDTNSPLSFRPQTEQLYSKRHLKQGEHDECHKSVLHIV